MRNSLIIIATLSCLVTFGSSAFAAEKGIVETVATGCQKELETFCKDVTPGEGRVLACLYAFGDKLSSKCEYALYDAAAQLERFVAGITYLANECLDDVEKFCPNVPMGEDRILTCLDRNEAKVSSRCKQALKDLGLK